MLNQFLGSFFTDLKIVLPEQILGVGHLLFAAFPFFLTARFLAFFAGFGGGATCQISISVRARSNSDWLGRTIRAHRFLGRPPDDGKAPSSASSAFGSVSV